MTHKRKIARVPEDHQRQGIVWLVLEQDAETGGVSLFLHQSLSEASEFDSWYKTTEDAQVEAESWGIKINDWSEE